jgi:hypothetical protein
MAIEIATGRTTLMPPPNCRAPDGPGERLKPWTLAKRAAASNAERTPD